VLEHLIADGGSSDRTVSIVHSFEPRYSIRLVSQQADNGLYQAWNRAIKQSRGDWILFLGSDDQLVACDTLRKVADRIEYNNLGVYSFIFGTSIFWHEDYDWNSLLSSYQSGETQPPSLFFPGSIFFARRIFSDSNLFDESLKIVADYKFLALNNFYSSCYFLSMPVVRYQYGGISSNKKNEYRHFNERRRVLKDLGAYYPLPLQFYHGLIALSISFLARINLIYIGLRIKKTCSLFALKC